jgi:hypothetical protein
MFFEAGLRQFASLTSSRGPHVWRMVLEPGGSISIESGRENGRQLSGFIGGWRELSGSMASALPQLAGWFYLRLPSGRGWVNLGV